jgi:hypothetical protein
VRRIWLATALALVVALAAVVGSAAHLTVGGGTIQDWSFPVDLGSIPASVDIRPESLQKKSRGAPVIAFIELPAGSDASNIQSASVRLCLGPSPCDDGAAPDGPPGAKPKVGDHDGDGIADLKVTFDRAAVIALVADVTPPATVSFTVSGIVDPPGHIFAGSDTVKLVDPESAPAPAAEPTPALVPAPEPPSTPAPQPTPSPEPTPPPTPSPEPSPAPESSPSPAPEATPTSTPEPTPEPTPAPTPEPTPAPEPTPEPTPTPAP